MIRVAIPHWRGRVSPVLDVAGNAILVDVAEGIEQSRHEVAIDAEQPQARAGLFARHGTTVLICGAISWPMEVALSTAGIEVISQICGNLEQVLAAFITGQLQQGAFLMPGCSGRHRQLRMRCRRGRS